LVPTVDGREDWKNKRRSLFRDLSVAVAALVTSLPNSESNDSSEESKKKPSPVSSSQTSAVTHTDSKDGKDIVEGQALSRRRGFQRTKGKLKINKEEKYANKSNVYFVALFWGILLSRLWLHWDFIVILLIPISFYVLKKLISYWGSSINSSAPCMFLLSLWAR